jgi:hypothetical protein
VIPTFQPPISRAFVKLWEIVSSHKELASKLEELERKYDGQFKAVFDAIYKLMEPPASPGQASNRLHYGRKNITDAPTGTLFDFYLATLRDFKNSIAAKMVGRQRVHENAIEECLMPTATTLAFHNEYCRSSTLPPSIMSSSITGACGMFRPSLLP